MQCTLVCNPDGAAECVHTHFVCCGAKYIEPVMDCRPIDGEIYFPLLANVDHRSLQSNIKK